MKIPFGEFAPDGDLFNSASVANNVIAVRDHYIPLNDVGAAEVTNSLLGDDNIFIYIESTDTKVLVSSRTTSIIANGDSIHKTGLATQSGYTYGNKFLTWNKYLLIFGGYTVPQKILITGLDDGGATKTADIGGTPPASNCCAKVRDFVVLGGIYDSGDFFNRVRWSGFDDFEHWTVGTSQSDFQDLKEPTMVRAIIGGEDGVIFQDNTITRMTYIGSPLIFQFDEIANKGSKASGSIVEAGHDIYFLSDDGFYVLKNKAELIPIGQDKINNWFFDNFGSQYDSGTPGTPKISDSLLYSFIRGAFDSQNNTVIWSFSTSTNTKLNTQKQLIYSISANRFTTADIADVVDIFPIQPIYEGGYWDTGVYIGDPTINAQGFGVVIDNATRTAHYMTGAPRAATLSTAEISFDNTSVKINEIRPIINGTATVTTETRNLLTSSVTSTGPTSTDSTGKANVRTNARYTRIKCTTNGNFTQASGIEADIKAGGKR